jgi:hypothetical protein
MPPGVRNWEIVLVLALAISYHSIAGALDGGVDPAVALVRLVMAGVVSWAGVAVLERMWVSYSNVARQRQLTQYLERQAEHAQPVAQQNAAGHSTELGN